MLLAGTVMLVLRLAQPTEYPVDRTRDPDGEMVGRVAKVEPGTILLTSEPPGSGVVPVVVTKDTRIMLGTIEGWMNDVRAGGQIKVAYDLYEGKKVARVVEVLSEQGARRPAPVEPPGKGPAPVPQPEAPAPRPKAEPPRVALPKTVTPVPAPLAAPKPAPEAPAPLPQAEPRRVAQPKATPAPAATPAPPPIVPAPTPPPVVVAPPPPAPAAPASAPPAPPGPVPPAPEPARPPEPDSTDGSAAVDWLLKGRR